MALLGMTLLCFLLVSTTLPYHQAQASIRGFFGRKHVDDSYPPMEGICDSSVILHGYKCQELEVINQS